MKNLFKNNIRVIVAFVLGLLIAGGVGVYAFNIAASDVSYDNATSGLTGDNVKDALDDLYSKASNSITATNTTTSMDVSAWCTADVNSSFASIPNLGWKTIKVTSITDYVTSSGVFKVNGRQLNAGQSLDISGASTLSFTFSSMKKSGTENLVVCANKVTFQLLVN